MTKLACGANLIQLNGVLMSTTPTDRDIELLHMPAIAAQMPVVYRLHDDHRITGPRQGRWVEWRPKPSVLERLGGWLRALFGR